MTIERYKNDAVTKLDGAIDGVQLTLDVIDAAVFPTLTGGDQFRIRVDNEEDIIVSSVSGNTLTLSSRGTGATSHSDQSDVIHNLTADSLLNVPATVENLQTAETDTSKRLAPDGSGGVQFAAGGSGFGHSYIGYNTIGGSQETITARRIYAKSVTLSADGFLASIGAYLTQSTDNVFDLSVAVFDDNSGVVGNLLGYNTNPSISLLMENTSGSTFTPNWIQIPIGVWLPAATYWIAVQLNIGVNTGTFKLYYDTSGSDRTFDPPGQWWTNGSRHTQTNSTRKYSIRGSLLQ